MNYAELTAEQRKKVRACSTPEELLALAKEEGYELSAITGGAVVLDGPCNEVTYRSWG